MSLTAAVADAYSATGAAWQRGPGLVYDRLAEHLLETAAVPLRGRSVLDVGAGTGAATRAAVRRGARVVAVDVAFGMLAADATSRPPAVVADAQALPFPPRCFDVAVAAFSLNHLAEPVAGLREATRVTRRDGVIVVAAYASDDDHPAKVATDAAARARGWVRPPWYDALRMRAVPRLATVDRAVAAATAAGLDVVVAERSSVAFPGLTPADLVASRLGMAQLAPFVSSLSPVQLEDLVADAVARLGPAPVLERSVIELTGRVR